jgi:hypothetical protein
VALQLRTQERLVAFALGEMRLRRNCETKSFLVLVADILCQCVAAGRARSRGSVHWRVGSCGRRCSRSRRGRGAQSSGRAADVFWCHYRQSMRRASCRRIREKSGRVYSRLRTKRRQIFVGEWRPEIRAGWKRRRTWQMGWSKSHDCRHSFRRDYQSDFSRQSTLSQRPQLLGWVVHHHRLRLLGFSVGYRRHRRSHHDCRP